jgi:hypothetical protein
MKITFQQVIVMITGLLFAISAQAAADSYRFLHVTIETPWAIFLFLLVFIMIPFILMAMLYWYFAFKKNDDQAETGSSQQQTPAEKTGE